MLARSPLFEKFSLQRNFQGLLSIVQLSRLSVFTSRLTAHLLYHLLFALSRTFLFYFLSSFSSICLFLNLAIHFSENLGIFRVALLFICQRSVILLLLLFSAATLISYHDRFRLSTTFFDFFKSFFQPKNLRFCGGFSYYHIVSCFVNNFLHLFFKAFTMA